MQSLRGLPACVAGVELQILQLRGEMQEAFSATRSEFNGRVDDLRAEMHEMGDALRTEIRTGNQQVKDFMLMLYEDNKSTIRTIGEGTKRRKR